VALATVAFVVLSTTALASPAPAVKSVPDTYIPAAVAAAPAVAYDETAEIRAMKRRMAADRADRAAHPVGRPEASAATSTLPATPVASPVAAPAPPKKRAAAPKPRRRSTAPPAPRRARARPVTPVYVAQADGSRAAVVVAFALAQVGKPYVWAAAGPGAFDCSGLVMAAYARVGIGLPHQTGGIVGRGRQVGRGELQPGDVVFPASGHVGIYIGGGRMVHASTPRGGIKISTVYAFYTARRLL
jgi:cell wall-associated NlpC family hydrolase